jgi:7-carboxy-7-deazaguanine synthase
LNQVSILGTSQIVGYLHEIFISYQGEGGSVPGSCFGKRQIFVRLSGCNLAQGQFGTSGCFYCDSKEACVSNNETCLVQSSPYSSDCITVNNPVTPEQVIEFINALKTTDLHSISFTGGEPCMQKEFLQKLSQLCKEEGFKTYLETNGSVEWDPIYAKFDFCCCDIKDRTSNAASDWESLANQELNFIGRFLSGRGKIFAKCVVTSKTSAEDIRWIAEQMSFLSPDGTQVPLVLQIISSDNSKIVPSEEQYSALMEVAAEFISAENLSLSFQVHKYLNIK